MIKFISAFLLFWSNDYNILSCQPFHDERFPTLSEKLWVFILLSKLLVNSLRKTLFSLAWPLIIQSLRTACNIHLLFSVMKIWENVCLKKKYVWRKHEFIPMPYWKGWCRSNVCAWMGSTEYFSNKCVWILNINGHNWGFIFKIACLFVWYYNYLQYKFCWV